MLDRVNNFIDKHPPIVKIETHSTIDDKFFSTVLFKDYTKCEYVLNNVELEYIIRYYNLKYKTTSYENYDYKHGNIKKILINEVLDSLPAQYETQIIFMDNSMCYRRLTDAKLSTMIDDNKLYYNESGYVISDDLVDHLYHYGKNRPNIKSNCIIL